LITLVANHKDTKTNIITLLFYFQQNEILIKKHQMMKVKQIII